MRHAVEVIAPSRLHFGLFTFGEGPGRRFGGVGAMITEPMIRVRAEPAEQFSVTGRFQERAAAFANTYARSFRLAKPPACRLEIVSAPEEHHGLGLGTQLGMAIGKALERIQGIEKLPPDRLAGAVGRGARSAVGVHGFVAGGLIFDGGKTEGEQLGRLEARASLPAEWRFVLARPKAGIGLAGEAEVAAFSQLAPPPAATTERLRQLAGSELLPAAESADFDRFSSALHEFNVTAGGCFAAVQQGPFASSAIAEVVAMLQSHGCVGCGQSSWGPTVFGLASDAAQAERIADKLRVNGVETTVSSPNNSGAVVIEPGGAGNALSGFSLV